MNIKHVRNIPGEVKYSVTEKALIMSDNNNIVDLFLSLVFPNELKNK